MNLKSFRIAFGGRQKTMVKTVDLRYNKKKVTERVGSFLGVIGANGLR
jgi:hypothetical protein